MKNAKPAGEGARFSGGRPRLDSHNFLMTCFADASGPLVRVIPKRNRSGAARKFSAYGAGSYRTTQSLDP